MIGLMQIMIYMLAVYLVFKGVEILQIALMSSRSNRTLGIIIGILAIAIAIMVGGGLTFWAELQAASISDRMNNLPILQR